jgi:hypothetical protein
MQAFSDCLQRNFLMLNYYDLLAKKSELVTRVSTRESTVLQKIYAKIQDIIECHNRNYSFLLGGFGIWLKSKKSMVKAFTI